MTKANDLAGWFVLLVVVVSPIPLGNNPPIFWAIAGMLIGAAAALYLAYGAMANKALRVPVMSLYPVIIPGLLLCCWLAAQALPLGALLGPFQFKGAAGQTITANSLSIAPDSTWMMLIRMVSFGFLFVLAVQVGANEQRAKKLLNFIFWAIVVHAAFALFQLTQLNDTILGFEKRYYQGVATGTFVNRNSFATFLAMGLSLGATLIAEALLSRRARNERVRDAVSRAASLAGGVFVIVIALLATQSRMGFFAALLGVTLIAGISLSRTARPQISLLVALLALIGAATAALWMFGEGLLERSIGVTGDSLGRLGIYEQVWSMILERPWLGYGGGAFELAFPMYFGPPLSPEFLLDKAHSTYLTLAAELGVVASLLPIGIIAYLFVRSARRCLAQREGALLNLAPLGTIIVGAVHSTVDFSLEMQANAFLLIAVAGICYATGSRTGKL